MIGKTIIIKSEYPNAGTDIKDEDLTRISSIAIRWDATCDNVIEEFLALLQIDGYSESSVKRSLNKINNYLNEENEE